MKKKPKKKKAIKKSYKTTSIVGTISQAQIIDMESNINLVMADVRAMQQFPQFQNAGNLSKMSKLAMNAELLLRELKNLIDQNIYILNPN